MPTALQAALIGVLAGTLTQLVIFAAMWGGVREKVRSHSDLFKLLPCLKPGAGCVLTREDRS